MHLIHAKMVNLMLNFFEQEQLSFSKLILRLMANSESDKCKIISGKASRSNAIFFVTTIWIVTSLNEYKISFFLMKGK